MRTAGKVLEAPTESALLKPSTVAQRLQIGQRTLWRWISAGVFPKPDLRLGTKVVRWRAETLTDWIEAKTNRGAQ
jgi:predicted DNA-binding transcriptional regulator AlpA